MWPSRERAAHAAQRTARGYRRPGRLRTRLSKEPAPGKRLGGHAGSQRTIAVRARDAYRDRWVHLECGYEWATTDDDLMQLFTSHVRAAACADVVTSCLVAPWGVRPSPQAAGLDECSAM